MNDLVPSFQADILPAGWILWPMSKNVTKYPEIIHPMQPFKVLKAKPSQQTNFLLLKWDKVTFLIESMDTFGLDSS